MFSDYQDQSLDFLDMIMEDLTKMIVMLKINETNYFEENQMDKNHSSVIEFD
jgi:hypothetical protein